jgi:hypothetical protein
MEKVVKILISFVMGSLCLLVILLTTALLIDTWNDPNWSFGIRIFGTWICSIFYAISLLGCGVIYWLVWKDDF